MFIGLVMRHVYVDLLKFIIYRLSETVVGRVVVREGGTKET